MPNRLARKPSTASLTPAARNSTKAIHICPEEIAQTTTGTNRIRPNVIRFGILKGAPARLASRQSITAAGPLRDLRFLRYDPFFLKEALHGGKTAQSHLRAGGRRYRCRQPDGGPDQAAGARHRPRWRRRRNRRLRRPVRPQGRRI